MMAPENALFALAAAASWGGGDFCGGMGVKAAGANTAGALRLVIVAHAVSLSVLLVVLALTGARVPHGAAVWWALAAGVSAAVSLTSFYMALARGAMGASAAVSGVLAAAIPAVVSMAMEGAPAMLRVGGFVLAIAAIWMIAAGPSAEDVGAQKTMGLAVVGGLGFGFYFVALKMANGLGVMEPMALARAATLVVCGGMLVVAMRAEKRGASGEMQILSCAQDDNQKGSSNGGNAPAWLGKQALLWALGVAALDTGGNLLFLAATRLGRLDVAAVLASLYPAGTILLAAWRLQERPTRRQVAGMLVAGAAVVMITV
jgi:uncharacterized membrane protein